MKACRSVEARMDPNVKVPQPSPGVRTRVLDRIRLQVTAGTYESERKLDVAIRGLVTDLDLDPLRSARQRNASPDPSGATAS